MIFPVPRLSGRLPVISDGFATLRTKPDGSQAIHGGIDIDYRALPTDPPFGTPHVRTKGFFMPSGVPFLAIDDGVVTVAGMFSFGGGIQIRHTSGPLKGATTFYAHASRVDVVPGQAVKAGQKLGIIGFDPRGGQGFNHLHLELWPDGTVAGRVDPEPHLAGAVKIDPPFGFGDALLVGGAVVGSLFVGRWLATRR